MLLKLHQPGLFVHILLGIWILEKLIFQFLIFKSPGRSGFLWPGLNVPLIKSGVVQNIGQRSKEEQQKVEATMVEQREEWDRKRKIKVKRERGWSGNTWGGVSIGPPDPGPNGGSRAPVLLAFVTVRRWLCDGARVAFAVILFTCLFRVFFLLERA